MPESQLRLPQAQTSQPIHQKDSLEQEESHSLKAACREIQTHRVNYPKNLSIVNHRASIMRDRLC